MTNAPYDQTRYFWATGALDWRATDLVLVAWAGTPNFVQTDKTVSEIVARGVTTLLGYSQAISGNLVAADGVMQTSDVIIPDVPVGPPLTHFTMCRRNPSIPALSELLFYIDDVYGLPFEPNGLDIEVTPDWLQHRGWAYA